MTGGDQPRRDGRALLHVRANEKKRRLARTEVVEDLVDRVRRRTVVEGEGDDLLPRLDARDDDAEELVRGRLAVEERAAQCGQNQHDEQEDPLHANRDATFVMKASMFAITRFESWLLKSNQSIRRSSGWKRSSICARIAAASPTSALFVARRTFSS